MNSTVNQEGPAKDPLIALEEAPVSAYVPGTQVVAASSNMQLPAVVLTQITKPGSLIDTSQLPQAEIVEVEKLAAVTRLSNVQGVEMFGYEMQKQYSDGLSQLLGASTLGQTGMYDFIAQDLKLSTEIVQEAIEAFGAKDDDVGTVRKILRSVPFLGKQVSKAEVLLKSRERLTQIFDKLEGKIAERQRTLVENDVSIEKLTSNLKTYLFLLRRHILAGERALLSMYDEYRVREQSLPHNPDPMQVAELVEARNLIIGFEVRLVGLKNAYVKAATLLPTQLSGIKQATQIVMQNLRDTITMAIPDLKTSALQLVALNNIQEASAQNRSIRDQQAKAAEQAQELLGTVLTTAKEQQGEALDEATRLRNLLKKTGELQEKLTALDAQNAEKRRKAEELLVQTKNEFDAAQERTSKKFLELAKSA